MSLRAGIRVSLLSIAWTVTASSAAVILGITSHSIVLVAFALGVAVGAIALGVLLVRG